MSKNFNEILGYIGIMCLSLILYYFKIELVFSPLIFGGALIMAIIKTFKQ